MLKLYTPLVAWFLLLSPCLVQSASTVHPEDATLHALDFVDRHEGWAVGDQGTVWHTLDAGQTWTLEPIYTNQTLTAINMESPWSGFALARENQPYSLGSLGTVYRTTNGGVDWARVDHDATMAGARELYVNPDGEGILIGESSDQHPSGIAVTRDGGATWIPLREPFDLGWTASRILNAEHFLLASARGHVMHIHGFELKKDSDLQMPAGSAVRCITSGGGRIWAAADGCMLFSSGDSGMTWKRHTLPVSAETAVHWQLSAVTAVGTHVWAVGRPGSVVLSSHDSGETWEIVSTGSPVPLRAIEFVDETHGWAVGDFGTILATTDGGAHWSIQRQGDQQAAILWLLNQPTKLPMTAVAQWGAADGYRQVALAPGASNVDPYRPGSATRSVRFHEAFRRAGGTSAELRPGRIDGLSEAEMILAIRMCRPEIVMADESKDVDLSSLATKAADPSVYPEQIDVLKLSPAAPKRVSLLPHGAEGAAGLHAISDGAWTEVRTAAELGWAYLADQADAPVTARRVVPGNSERPAWKSPFDGMTDIAPDSPGRRPASVVAIADRDDLMLVPFPIEDWPASTDEQKHVLDQYTVGAPADRAGLALFVLARRFVDADRPDDARKVFEYLIVRWPRHPSTDFAYRWLMTSLVSQERAALEGAAPLAGKLRLALAYGQKLRTDGHPLARHPDILVTLASAAEQLGDSERARGYLDFVQASSFRWQNDPAVALGLGREITTNRLPIRWTTFAPTIDGRLDDACWTTDAPTPVDSDRPTLSAATDADRVYFRLTLARTTEPWTLQFDLDRDPSSVLEFDASGQARLAGFAYPARAREVSHAGTQSAEVERHEWAVPRELLGRSTGNGIAQPLVVTLVRAGSAKQGGPTQERLEGAIILEFETDASQTGRTIQAN